MLPLFPLHTVLFPGGPLALHIFEERYRLLVRQRRDFGVVLIREGREVGQPPRVHEVGTVATLEQVEELPDGRFDVLARGLGRFRIRRLDASGPGLAAVVDTLAEPAGRASARLLLLLERYLAGRGLRFEPGPDGQPAPRAAWVAGSLLRVEAPKLQRLLESGDPELAEELLEAELARFQRIGPTAPLTGRRQSPN